MTETAKPPTNVHFTAKGSQVYVTWTPPEVPPNWYILRSKCNLIRLSIEGWRTDYLSPELIGGTFILQLYSVNSSKDRSSFVESPPLNFI